MTIDPADPYKIVYTFPSTPSIDDRYGPMLDPLNAVFGEGVFAWWHTGGGCIALEAHLEGDITVLITDDPHTDHGEDAHITEMGLRLPTDESFGYCVGVYGDEGCDLLAMDFCGSVEELPAAVTATIIEGVKTRFVRAALRAARS